MIQDRAHDFNAAVDRDRTRAASKPRLQERLQRLIMNLVRLEISEEV